MQGLTHTVTVGDWYRVALEPPFEVVAVDADQETIEIQYFDGTVQEIAFDDWMEMKPQPSAPPEDFSGAMDIEKEDSGIEPELLQGDPWNNPLDNIERFG